MTELKRRILVIEDEKEMLEAVQLRLEANRYEVISASDGAEGLSQARSEKPDLIIMDIMLPKMDGFTVCRMLKFDEHYKNTPIIMLTARTQDSDIKCGKEMGVDAYLTKPFKSEELLAKIKELIK